MSVDHRRLYIGVAEKFLNGAVVAESEQVAKQSRNV
jgi:hypothetical protein